MEVRPERRTALAFRWIKTYARERKDKSMALKVAAELMAAANGEGSAVKKKDDTHRMAEANKASPISNGDEETKDLDGN